MLALGMADLSGTLNISQHVSFSMGVPMGLATSPNKSLSEIVHVEGGIGDVHGELGLSLIAQKLFSPALEYVWSPALLLPLSTYWAVTCGVAAQE